MHPTQLLPTTNGKTIAPPEPSLLPSSTRPDTDRYLKQEINRQYGLGTTTLPLASQALFRNTLEQSLQLPHNVEHQLTQSLLQPDAV